MRKLTPSICDSCGSQTPEELSSCMECGNPRLRLKCSAHHHACDCREVKLLSVLKPHMVDLKLEGLRGNQIALQAFIDIDETWRELYGCSIEDDERYNTP